MDSSDGIPEMLAGIGCTACGASLAADRIVVLAVREELAFVEFRCLACGSESLGLVVLDEATLTPASADIARFGEFGPADEVRLAGSPPIDGEDVRRMRAFLASWDGDLRGLLERHDPGASPA